MTGHVLGGGIALALISCSASAPESKPTASEAEYQIRRILSQIDLNWFGDPDEPVARLAEFGRASLPFLNRSRTSASPAVEQALQRAIAKIHATDPYFLVRAPDRRVSARLKSASRTEGYLELFKAFPIRPGMSPRLDLSHPVPRVPVWLNDATYWEAVRAFSGAFDVDLHGEFFEPSKSIAWSRPHGSCILSAKRTASLLTVRIHLEPGTQPIDGSLPFLKLVDAAGRNIAIQPEPEGASFMRRTAGRLETTVGATQLTLPDDAGPLTLTGVARVVLPVDIETAVWTIDDWDQQPVRTLGPWGLELMSFDRFEMRHTSSDVAGEDDADAYRRHAWIFFSDDEGRSSNPFTLGAGEGGALVGANWPHDRPYTRVTVLRPVKAEVVEFPFEIKGIRPP